VAFNVNAVNHAAQEEFEGVGFFAFEDGDDVFEGGFKLGGSEGGHQSAGVPRPYRFQFAQRGYKFVLSVFEFCEAGLEGGGCAVFFNGFDDVVEFLFVGCDLGEDFAALIGDLGG